MCDQRMIAWQHAKGYPGEKPVYLKCIKMHEHEYHVYEVHNVGVYHACTVYRSKSRRGRVKLWLSYIEYRKLLRKYWKSKTDVKIASAKDDGTSP